MFLAAEKTIGDAGLMLPDAAQSLLHVEAMGKLAYLLEFVDADHYVEIFLLRDDFRQRQNFFGTVLLRRNSERD